MSIFQDSNNVYHLDWDSSPWKPYYNKLTSRYLEEDSGDDTTIKVWCAEEELEGKVFTLTCDTDTVDKLTSVSYPNPAGGPVFNETDDFLTDVVTAHDDRTVKWWYGPGVAMQFPDGTHATTAYTQSTVYTHTIAASDIGEKVYDGGIHCWMKLPHAAQDGGTSPATETDIYSKNIPMEYINSDDFLIVFNSYGHRPIKVSGTNIGLTIQFQYADVLNAETGQFVNATAPIWDDIDIGSTTTDVNTSHMAASLITSGGFDKRENVKSIRFYWYTEDTTGTEAIFHGGQFIRMSLYPVKR
tara:strand:- start:223 stop:1119 length:897 start_codon:yes stop_codon:yes gene_type:complete